MNEVHGHEQETWEKLLCRIADIAGYRYTDFQNILNNNSSLSVYIRL